MNAIVQHTSQAGTGLVPQNMNDAVRLAELMAKGRMIPQHFQGQPGDCLMVVEQAMRWNMSPFAVAQCAANVKGKLCYEGKLIAAAVSSCGAIKSEFDYDFTGDPKNPQTLSVRASAVRASDGKVKHVDVAWKDAKTTNEHWTKSPEQMLTYHAARVWARRWTPGVLLGVYAREEFDADGTPPEPFVGTTIDGEPTRDTDTAQPQAQPEQPRRQTVAEFLDGLQRQFEAVKDRSAFDALVASDAVQNAVQNLRNGAAKRLDDILNAAEERIAATPLDGSAEDDGWPGPQTQAA